MSATPTTPAALAGLFGQAVAEADLCGKRLVLEPLPGVLVPVVPEFAELPVRNALLMLLETFRLAAQRAGIEVSHLFPSDATCPPPAASHHQPVGAPGGEARQPSGPVAWPGRGAQPAGRERGDNLAPAGTVIPFPIIPLPRGR